MNPEDKKWLKDEFKGVKKETDAIQEQVHNIDKKLATQNGSIKLAMVEAKAATEKAEEAKVDATKAYNHAEKAHDKIGRIILWVLGTVVGSGGLALILSKLFSIGGA